MPLHIKTDFCSHAQTWNASVHTALTDSGGRFCLFLPADETAVHLSFWSQKAVFVYNGPVLHFFLLKVHLKAQDTDNNSKAAALCPCILIRHPAFLQVLKQQYPFCRFLKAGLSSKGAPLYLPEAGHADFLFFSSKFCLTADLLLM